MSFNPAAFTRNLNYPTAVRFGPGRIRELPEACRALGMTRPLLVTDPGLAALPVVAEALRFNHRFSFEFQIDETLHPESVAVPGMLLQPHIENAIWHGIMHKEGNGQLWVRFLKTGDHTLVCEIEDNGVGRLRPAATTASSPLAAAARSTRRRPSP